jgi:hypothetical protein
MGGAGRARTLLVKASLRRLLQSEGMSGFFGRLLRAGAVGMDLGAAHVAQAVAEHVGAEEVAFFGA